MKHNNGASLAFACSWIAAYALTAFAFTSSLDSAWLLFLAPAAWLAGIVLTFWLLDLKQRSLSWVFLAIVPFGWAFLLSLSTPPRESSVGGGGTRPGRVVTATFLAICGLVFLASAFAGLYFSLKPAAYPNVTERVTAMPVFLCFLLIGLIWGRFAIRKARGLEG